MVNDFGLEEDCISINLNAGAPKKSVLSDINCEESYRFICEVFLLVDATK